MLIALLSILSLFTLFFLPGLVWRRLLFGASAEAHEPFSCWFLTSLLLFTVVTSAFKLSTGAPLTRGSFLALYMFLVVSGLLLLGFKRELRTVFVDSKVVGSREVVVGLTLCCVLGALMHDKVFVENFITDGIESFEFSRSLRSHVLPNWDLENGYFGFYPYFMLFAYPNSFSILLFGESEAAVRLPFFLFLFLTYLVSIRLIRTSREASTNQLLFLTLPFALLTILQGYYYSWEADTDLAQPAATDLLFVFLFLLASFHLVNGRYRLFLVVAALGIISLPSGRLFLVLSVLACALSFRPGKRTVLTLAVWSVALLLGAEILHKIYVFYVPQGDVKFDVGFLVREYLTGIRADNLIWDFKTLWIVTGIVPLLACGLVVRDRVSRYFIYILVAYFAVVMVIPNAKLHYFMPLSVGVVIIAMRKVSDQGESFRRSFYALSSVSFLALIVACYPKGYEPYTLARDLGARSCMTVSSYEDAVRHFLPIYDGLPLLELGINPHAWIHYSDLTRCPKEHYDFYFTLREMALDGYAQHRLDNGSYFYAREGALPD